MAKFCNFCSNAVSCRIRKSKFDAGITNPTAFIVQRQCKANLFISSFMDEFTNVSLPALTKKLWGYMSRDASREVIYITCFD